MLTSRHFAVYSEVIMKLQKEKYLKLSLTEKEICIKLIKDRFEKELSKQLDLLRVSAPIIIDPTSGLQDDLSGVERKVEFDLRQNKRVLQVVQSLAKWKRFALKQYGFETHKGLYTDMMAIRRDDVMDEIHSIYVDQWDWEKIIEDKDRTISFLKSIVKKIVKAIKKTSDYVEGESGFQFAQISDQVEFITAQKLLELYPLLSPKEREYEFVKNHKTVFIIGVGNKLSNGEPHDLRAPDYDDWNLNGDLLYYHEVLDMAMEISSMGIRVNEKSLLAQCEKANSLERLNLPYHKAVLEQKLPLTIGGGIGQSRLCMLLLSRAHIGEVQSSYWPDEILLDCSKKGIELL